MNLSIFKNKKVLAIALGVIIVAIVGIVIFIGGNQSKDDVEIITSDPKVKNQELVENIPFELDSEVVAELGIEATLEDLMNEGIVDEEAIALREALLQESEEYAQNHKSFYELVNVLMEDYPSLEHLLLNDLGVRDLIDIITSFDSQDQLLVTVEDITVYQQIYNKAVELIAADAPTKDSLQEIVTDLESNTESEIKAMDFIYETNVKGQKIKDDEVILRWQQDSNWIPDYGYNLYRVTDGDIDLVASEIGSIANIMSNSEDYALEYLDRQGITSATEISSKAEGFEKLIQASLVDTDKAKLIGFSSADSLDNYLIEGFDQRLEQVNIMLSESAFTYNRNSNYEAIEPIKFTESDLRLDTVIAGNSNLMNFKDNTQLSIPNNLEVIKENLAQSEADEELKNIIDSRALIAAGCDVDIELALAAGFAFRDNISNIDSDYMIYVLEPVYNLSEQMSEDQVLSKLSSINLNTGYTEDVENLKNAVKNNPEDTIVTFTTVVPTQNIDELLAPVNIQGYGANNRAILRWDTVIDGYTERITSGYNVYRKLNDESTFTQLNTEPILVQYNQQEIAGQVVNVESSFFYMDEEVSNKDHVEYKVESIDLFGRVSGLSEDTLVIDTVVKTIPPNVPAVDKPIMVRTSKDLETLVSVNYKIDSFSFLNKEKIKDVVDVEDRIILPLSNSNPEIVLLNIYRSKAYGKDQFSEPEFVTSLNSINKQQTIANVIGRANLDSKRVYIPGMYFEDKDIEKGYYYKYWVSGVDEWGNESSWSYGLTVGYPREEYNDSVSSVTSTVIEEVRYSPEYILPGVIINRFATTSDIQRIHNEVIGGGLALTNKDLQIQLDDIDFSGNSNMAIEAASSTSVFGESFTLTSMKDNNILPGIISKELLNLPDVNQVHAMVGFTEEDFFVDGSLRVTWPKYTNDDFANYAIYRGTISGQSLDELNSMNKGEVLESILNCELISEQEDNSLTDIPGSINNGDLIIYVVALIPEEGETVSAYSHLKTLEDSHAIGGWVNIQWDKPDDDFQVGGYKISKAYIEDFRLMEIEDIDESTIDYENLDWSMIEDDIDYTYFYESVDQMTEQHAAYKIEPINVWGVLGDPIYDYIRVPALIPPATPELLQPYSKPGTIEVRIKEVSDAHKYTVYRTSVPKIKRADVSAFLTKDQADKIFGIEKSYSMFENHSGIDMTLYEPNISLEEVAPTLYNIPSPLSYNDLSTAKLMNFTQVMDIDTFFESVEDLDDNTVANMTEALENKYGSLSIMGYDQLTLDKAKIIKWEKVADIYVADFDELNPMNGLLEYDSSNGTILYSDQDVDFQHYYHYSVTASNIDLESYKSSPFQGESKKNKALLAPSNLSVSSGMVSSINGSNNWGNVLTWTHAKEPGFTEEEVVNDLLVGYIVYRRTSSEGKYYQVSNVIKENRFVDYSAYAYQTYDYIVKAIDIAGLISEASGNYQTSTALLDAVNMAKNGILNAISGNVTILDPIKTMVLSDEFINSGNSAMEDEIKEELGSIPSEYIENFGLELLHDQSIPDELKDTMFDILKDDYQIDMNDYMKLQTPSGNNNVIGNFVIVEPEPVIIGNIVAPGDFEIVQPGENPDVEEEEAIEVAEPEGITSPVIDTSTIDFNTLDISNIQLTELKPITELSEFKMVLVDTEFERLRSNQESILGIEPEVSIYEIEGGWAAANGKAVQGDVDDGVYQMLDKYRTELEKAYINATTYGSLDIGGYLVEGIPESSLYKDVDSGTILKGSGYIYYGRNRVKVPVVFKVDYGQDSYGNEEKDFIDLAMFPYRSVESGLTLTSFKIELGSNKLEPATVSGYLRKPDGSYLLPDMHIIYFEDVNMYSTGVISIDNGAFPAFHFDDYLVYDYSSMAINIDYMVDIEDNIEELSQNSRYPITLTSGLVETSFGYPTMDNKGLEFGFKAMGIIPGHGLYGTMTAFPGTIARLIVPKGISVKLSSGTLVLEGDGSNKDYTSLVGEVMLPYLKLSDTDQMPVFDLGSEISQELGGDDPTGYVVNVFNEIKDGGLVLLGDENEYEISTIPFAIYGEDIDNGFILEHKKLARTFVGNYDIFDSRFLTEDYNFEEAELNAFVSAVESSLVIESEDATVDLSIVNKGSTTKPNRWYDEVEWKGILFDEAQVEISAYLIKRKDENSSEPISFNLRQQELIYDRNGFIYQNYMEALEDLPIVLGKHYGNFQNAVLQKGSAELYNGELEQTYIGSVMIPALFNQSVGFIMHEDALKGASCFVQPLEPNIIVLSGEGQDNVADAGISMEIYGGYFDEKGVHIEGALMIPDLSEEKLEFGELLLPSDQSLMSTFRDDLGSGESLEYGSAMFNKPYIVDFNGFKMEIAYFDMYSMMENSRSVLDLLNNSIPIYNVDLKLYGSAALSDNMEKKSSEKNAQLYIKDIHGQADYDYDKCLVQVKIPNGNGFITGQVQASPAGTSGGSGDMALVGQALNDASDASNEVLEALGNADEMLRLMNNKKEAINALSTIINTANDSLLDSAKSLIQVEFRQLLSVEGFTEVSLESIRSSVKQELRNLIDEINEQITEYNQLVSEMSILAEEMYDLPLDYDLSQYKKIEPINKALFMAFVDDLIDEIEDAIEAELIKNLDELANELEDLGRGIIEEFDLEVPRLDVSFDNIELLNQIPISGDQLDELASLTEETIGKVEAFKDVIDSIGGADDGIVQFIVSGEEAFEMVMDESMNFMKGTNVQAVGNFGYRVPSVDNPEPMYFYALGIGYVDTPNSPDASLNLGVIELANLVSVSGYNMILPYSQAEGYTVGHGYELLNSVTELKPDLTNSKESFFIAAGDAYIMSSRENHICALTEMRYISESDGSFEITGELMGPKRVELFAVPSANNSVKQYGGARILYNARNNGYKLTTMIDNIPIDPAGLLKVGGSIGLEWDDSSFMVKMGYPEDMNLVIGDSLKGTFGMNVGVNPYSENLIFMMKMGVGFDRSFDVGIVYADVGIHFDSVIGYGIWNLYDEEKEFPWYKDGAVFEGIGGDLSLYGYMRGGIDIGSKYNIISASIDASASIINPRDDLKYQWSDVKSDYVVRKTGVSDDNDWILHADLRVKYSIGFWLVSYSDDFYYDFQTTVRP